MDDLEAFHFLADVASLAFLAQWRFQELDDERPLRIGVGRGFVNGRMQAFAEFFDQAVVGDDGKLTGTTHVAGAPGSVEVVQKQLQIETGTSRDSGFRLCCKRPAVNPPG